MRGVLLDSDVVNFLHGLGLLVPCVKALAAKTEVTMTEFAARHEVVALAPQVTALEHDHLVVVRAAMLRTQAGERYRQFRKEVDKGEAEAIAWALDAAAPSRAVFCSGDRGARAFARQRGVPTTDLFGLVAGCTRHADLPADLARTQLAPWDSPAQQRGKPRDWLGFDAELTRRAQTEAGLFVLGTPG